MVCPFFSSIFLRMKLASLHMNYEHKQRLLMQMEEAVVYLYTAKTLRVNYV